MPTSKPAPKRAAKVDHARVNLDGPGYIELRIAVDLFTLADEDRAFVFGVIDRFNEWRTTRGEKQAQLPETS